jgi:predicted enzyme related to lactoylglutathione lyase
MKLFQTRVVTRDVPELAKFYQEITGVEPSGNSDYMEFRIEGGGFAICSQKGIDSHSAGAAKPQANQSAILDFQVVDVDRERARLTGKIGELVLEPTDQPWGNRSMLFRDPDGNLINFFSPVKRTKSPDAEN